MKASEITANRIVPEVITADKIVGKPPERKPVTVATIRSGAVTAGDLKFKERELAPLPPPDKRSPHVLVEQEKQLRSLVAEMRATEDQHHFGQTYLDIIDQIERNIAILKQLIDGGGGTP